MRSELNTLEKIDKYLSGKMSATEIQSFEQQMAGDPNLASLVNQQKDFIKAVNRKAIRSEIDAISGAIAGGASSGVSNLTLGLSGLAVVGVIVTSIIYFSSNSDPDVPSNQQEIATEDTYQIIPQLDAAAPAKKDMKTTLITADVSILHDSPETLFSSIKTYEEESDQDSSVNLSNTNFSNERELQTTKKNVTNNTGLLREVEDKPKVVTYKTTDMDGLENLSSVAHFDGGNIAMKNFIDRNLHYPQTARNKRIEGVVRVDFYVWENGKIGELSSECISLLDENGQPLSDVRRLMNNRIANLFIRNAGHVLRSMPDWVPSKDAQGNYQPSAQRMYFKYDLEDGCSAYQLDEEIPLREEN